MVLPLIAEFGSGEPEPPEESPCDVELSDVPFDMAPAPEREDSTQSTLMLDSSQSTLMDDSFQSPFNEVDDRPLPFLLL